VARTVEISDEGRAPKNDPAIFVLAIGAAHPDQAVRKLALAAVPKVCRTATHLFCFVKTVRALGRGWGRSLKTAVANWYNAKSLDGVAYQAIKYRERNGYSHKRLLQTAHPAASESPGRIALYRWMRGLEPEGELPPLVQAHLRAMKPETPKAEVLALITANRLPWEALPTGLNADPDAWRAMLPTLGLGAIVRNLGNMTRLGAIQPLSEAEAMVVERLLDDGAIRKSRLHPFSILLAMAVYTSGRGVRGSGAWDPSRAVIDALDGAFYKAFANVKASGKRVLIVLDVSGSMGSPIMGSPLTCRDATAALALVVMSTEKQTHVMGFTSAGHTQRRYGGLWGGARAELTPVGHLAAAAADRRGPGGFQSAVWRNGLRAAHTACAGAGDRGGRVLRLRQRNLGGRGAPGQGAAAVSAEDRHLGQACCRRHDGDWLLDRGSERRRHAGCRRLRRRRAGGDGGFHPLTTIGRGVRASPALPLAQRSCSGLQHRTLLLHHSCQTPHRRGYRSDDRPAERSRQGEGGLPQRATADDDGFGVIDLEAFRHRSSEALLEACWVCGQCDGITRGEPDSAVELQEVEVADPVLDRRRQLRRDRGDAEAAPTRGGFEHRSLAEADHRDGHASA
jgi:hypothetical protein